MYTVVVTDPMRPAWQETLAICPSETVARALCQALYLAKDLKPESTREFKVIKI